MFGKSTAKVCCVIAAAALLFTGCAPAADSALVNINNGQDKITYGYGLFETRYLQALYDTMNGGGMWDQKMSEDSETTIADDVKNELMDTIEQHYLLKQHAADYGVELSANDEKLISDALKNFKAANGDDVMKAMGATDEYITEYLTYTAYAIKVQQAIYDEASLDDITDAQVGQSSIEYAFLPFGGTTTLSQDDASSDGDIDSETVPMTEEEKQELYELADDIATAGDENFETRTEGQGLEVKTFSFTTADESYDGLAIPNEVIIAAKKLNDGEVSEVIEAPDKGYYVVKMIAKNDEEATEARRQNLISQAQSAHYNEVMQGWKEETTWVVDKGMLDSISMLDYRFETKPIDPNGLENAVQDALSNTDSEDSETSDSE